MEKTQSQKNFKKDLVDLNIVKTKSRADLRGLAQIHDTPYDEEVDLIVSREYVELMIDNEDDFQLVQPRRNGKLFQDLKPMQKGKKNKRIVIDSFHSDGSSSSSSGEDGVKRFMHSPKPHAHHK